MSVQDWGGLVLSAVIFGVMVACSRGDGPREWFKR